MNEKQLIVGCKANKPKAQRALYETFAPKMMALCLRYMRDREAACDLLQDGFVKVFTQIETFQEKGSFEGWIRRVFVNTALEKLRRRDVLNMATDLDQVVEPSTSVPSAIENMAAAELMELVKALPDGFRTVFNMFAIEGYSHKEIANMLEISEGTSRSQYARARAVLQRQIVEMND